MKGMGEGLKYHWRVIRRKIQGLNFHCWSMLKQLQEEIEIRGQPVTGDWSRAMDRVEKIEILRSGTDQVGDRERSDEAPT